MRSACVAELIRQRLRPRRLGDSRLGLEHLADAPQRPAHPRQRLGGRRQRRRELERGERHDRDHRQQDDVEASGAHRRDTHQQAAERGQRRQHRRQALTDSRRQRPAARDPRQPRVDLHGLAELAVRRSEGGKLGGAADELDDRRAQRASHLGLRGLSLAGQPLCQPRHDGRGEQQGHRDDRPGCRQQHPLERDRADSHDDRDRERSDDPDEQVLDRIDVVDEPRHQVAAAKRGQAARRQRLQRCVDAHPQVGERAQRRVMPDQPLSVARQSLRQPEELDRDDPERQRGLVRVLSGARDQPCRRREQPDPRPQRARPEQARLEQPPTRRLDERQRRSHAGTAIGVRSTTVSARATSAGRCATTIAVRPRISRCTASSTSSSVAPSRLAVGSSSSSSGASRRNSRASATR